MCNERKAFPGTTKRYGLQELNEPEPQTKQYKIISFKPGSRSQKLSRTVNNTLLSKLAPGAKSGLGPLVTLFSQNWLPEPKRSRTKNIKNLEEPAPEAKTLHVQRTKSGSRNDEKVWAPGAERTRTVNKIIQNKRRLLNVKPMKIKGPK